MLRIFRQVRPENDVISISHYHLTKKRYIPVDKICLFEQPNGSSFLGLEILSKFVLKFYHNLVT